MDWGSVLAGGERWVVAWGALPPSLPAGLARGLARAAWLIALLVGGLIALQGVDIVVAVHAFGLSCPGAPVGCVGRLASGSADLIGGATTACGLTYLSAVRDLRDRRLAGWRRLLVGSCLQLLAVGILLVVVPSLAVVIGLAEVCSAWYLLAQIHPYFAS
jgi:hypothetical protein